MISSGGKHIERKFNYLYWGGVSYTDAVRGISPGEPYFCAEFRATGTDELLKQPKYECISPDVHRGQASFLEWRHSYFHY